MFPGQSSVGPAVLSRARQAHPAAEHIADRARLVLGEARASEYLDAGGARLRSNRDTQITVFLSSQMYLAAMHAEGIEGGGSLGLSLGEYSHLVHIGALDLDDALRLVDERGRCYDEAPPGIMATVLAVDYDTVAAVVTRARAYGPVVISNVNAPTQHVIAGA
jgi:[acyl-carrier-protein] S-malonyltransferase